MAQTCGRCGATFEELVAGGCPGCGRKVAAGNAPGRGSAPLRAYSATGGTWIWRLGALAVAAVLAGLAWIVYLKATAVPPPPPPPAAKKLATLKDWEASIAPAKLIPAMDALRVHLDKAEPTPLEALVASLKRVVQGATETDARVMLLSALRGRKGRAAAGILSLLSERVFVISHRGDEESAGVLQAITFRAVLEHADETDADVRRAAAACLRQLPPVLARGDRTVIWEMDALLKSAVREACHRLAKDARPETRADAAKALDQLDGK